MRIIEIEHVYKTTIWNGWHEQQFFENNYTIPTSTPTGLEIIIINYFLKHKVDT